MTEADWQVSASPKLMLRFLLGIDAHRILDVPAFPNCKVSERKLRLFACACYARIRHLLADTYADEAIAVAERFSDAQATDRELAEATARIRELLDGMEMQWRAAHGAERAAKEPTYDALALALQATRPMGPKAAWYASSNAYLNAASLTKSGFPMQQAEERAQAGLLREIIGPLPFRAVRCEARWQTKTVVGLARAAYEERCLDNLRLVVLADALEECGGDNEEVLGHLRQQGTVHVRGCWCLDLLLQKN